ncbi:MAG: ribonuclease P protein component 1 [Candidatus Woesearchaeota archaeon]
MIREELLGQHARVVRANNHSLNNISGEVVDETQKTLRIRTNTGVKTVLKSHAHFQINGLEIQGSLLARRPHERTKIQLTQWHKKTTK